MDDMDGMNDQTAGSEWPDIEIEPTNLIALWPGDVPPTLTEIIAGLESACGSLEVEPLDVDEMDVPWAAGLRITGYDMPVMIWSELARPLPTDESERIGAEPCRWVVGLESLLGDDPLADFVRLMRLLRDGLEVVPAVLDVNTTSWYSRQDLDEVFGDEAIEPPADVLWTIHAVTPDPDEGRGDATWLHTHGLWRCGCLELEMIEVPRECMAEAAELINTVGELVLESGTPRPGEPMAVGDQLAVVLQPWQSVAPYVAPGAPGGEDDRDDEAHCSIRAVICDQQPAGRYRAMWVWPHEIVRRMREGDTVMYRTVRSTERQSRMAQAHWDQLGTAFATWRQHGESDRVMFLIKAGFTRRDDPERREHLWFRIDGFNGGAASGVLLNDPLHIGDMQKDDHVSIRRDIVSDWSVLCPNGAFGPGDVKAMWRAFDEMEAG